MFITEIKESPVYIEDVAIMPGALKGKSAEILNELKIRAIAQGLSKPFSLSHLDALLSPETKS